jgi:hypothetical protein
MTKPAKGRDAEAVLEFGAGHVMPSEDLFKLGVYPFLPHLRIVHVVIGLIISPFSSSITSGYPFRESDSCTLVPT